MGLNSIYFQEFKLFASAFSRGIFKRWIFSEDSMAQNLWFFLPLVLVLSVSSHHFLNFFLIFLKVKTSIFEWKHCHILSKWWSFHPIPLFEQKKVPSRSDDFFMTQWFCTKVGSSDKPNNIFWKKNLEQCKNWRDKVQLISEWNFGVFFKSPNKPTKF